MTDRAALDVEAYPAMAAARIMAARLAAIRAAAGLVSAREIFRAAHSLVDETLMLRRNCRPAEGLGMQGHSLARRDGKDGFCFHAWPCAENLPRNAMRCQG